MQPMPIGSFLCRVRQYLFVENRYFLENYFLQNKLIAFNDTNNLINFDYMSFYKDLIIYKNKQYNSFLYTGHNPYVVLFLLMLNIDFQVEIIFGNQHINKDNFEPFAFLRV